MNATDSPPPAASGSGVGRWIALAILAAVVFVYVMFVTAPNQQGGGIEGPAIGRKLPYLQLQPLTGSAEAVATHDLEGHVTLLNFWGTWCPPCVAEFPHLAELAGKFKANPQFRFYPVSCGGGGSDSVLNELRTETEAFLQARKSELPTYADQDGTTRQALMAIPGLEQFAYPTTLVIDRQGAVRGVWVGFNPSAIDDMQALVERLLQDPKPQAQAAG